MKTIKFIFVAMLSIASLVAEPTSPSTPIPTESPVAVSVPDHISIGEIAIVEALAKATNITVVCGSASTMRPFTTSQPLNDINSIADLKSAVSHIYVDFVVVDPKERINLSCYIKSATGENLFRSDTTFRLEKVYNPSTKKFVYRAPYYAGNLWFNMSDYELYFPGAQTAQMIARNGDIYDLSVINGRVMIPGWMNSYGQFTEFVVDGVRYDMNTGIRLHAEICETNFLNAQVNGIEQVDYNSVGRTVITAYPQYGSASNYEVTVTDNHLCLDIQTGSGWNFIRPISVYIATLDDLKPGGKGWTVYLYATGMDINLPSGTYYVHPEYQNDIIGSAISSTGGGGQGYPPDPIIIINPSCAAMRSGEFFI